MVIMFNPLRELHIRLRRTLPLKEGGEFRIM